MPGPRKGAAPAVGGSVMFRKKSAEGTGLGAHGRITKAGTSATGQFSEAEKQRQFAKGATAAVKYVAHRVAAPNLHVSGKGSATPPKRRKG